MGRYRCRLQCHGRHGRQGARVFALGNQHEWVDIGADYSVMGIRGGAGFGIREST